MSLSLEHCQRAWLLRHAALGLLPAILLCGLPLWFRLRRCNFYSQRKPKIGFIASQIFNVLDLLNQLQEVILLTVFDITFWCCPSSTVVRAFFQHTIFNIIERQMQRYIAMFTGKTESNDIC